MYFRQYFELKEKSNLGEVLENAVLLKVIKCRRGLWPNKTVAMCALSLDYIWEQDGHSICEKWIPLYDPAEPMEGVRGHLQVEIQIKTCCALTLASSLRSSDEDDLQRNVLTHHGRPVQLDSLATYVVKLYQLDCMRPAATSCHPGLSSKLSVVIKVAGLKARVQGGDLELNQAVEITDFHPPLWRFIYLKLHDENGCVAQHAISMHQLTSHSKSGLPTFGPSFLQLYSKSGAYIGQILLSIETHMNSNSAVRQIKNSPCEPCSDQIVFYQLAIFGSLSEAHLLRGNLLGHDLQFSVSFGDQIPGQTVVGSNKVCAYSADDTYCSFPLSEIAPCASAYAAWPVRWHSLQITRVLLPIVELLGKIKLMPQTELEVALRAVISRLKNLISPLDHCLCEISSKHESCGNFTRLDALRLRSFTQLSGELKGLDAHNLKEGSKRLVEKILNLITDPQQTGIPLLRVQLVHSSSGQPVAETTIDPTEIANTPQGCHLNLELKAVGAPQNKKRPCSKTQLRTFLWLGKRSDISQLPFPANSAPVGTSTNMLPIELCFSAKQTLECRVYIHSGSIVPGWDEDGLCDPYVRVSCLGKSCCTKVVEKTLSPFWNQTLLLRPLNILGSAETVSSSPPNVVLELMDQDLEESGPDYVGAATLRPKVLNLIDFSVEDMEKVVLRRGGCEVAEIIVALDLALVQEENHLPTSDTVSCSIIPALRFYHLEVILYSLHSLHRLKEPTVVLHCSDREFTVNNSALRHRQNHLYFQQQFFSWPLELPEDERLLPALTISLFERRNSRPMILKGCGIASSCKSILAPEPFRSGPQRILQLAESAVAIEVVRPKNPKLYLATVPTNRFQRWLHRLLNKPLIIEDHTFDNVWWDKLPSMGEDSNWKRNQQPLVQVKMYPHELESEFGDFHDTARPYPLMMGFRSDRGSDPPTVAILKAGLSLRPSNSNEQTDSSPEQIHNRLEKPHRVLARLYVLNATDLSPKDRNGHSDPYIRVCTSRGVVVNDRKNYIRANLNPEFGRCFEVTLTLPEESELTIAVYDYDMASSDDLIGDTTIDVEQRLFSRHRATCGISARYDRTDYNTWRDRETPTEILEKLCTQNSIDQTWCESNEGDLQLSVGSLTVKSPPHFKTIMKPVVKEQMALTVLRRWKAVAGWELVPEHVEKRSLFDSRRPGIVQGYLIMWLDLFPLSPSLKSVPLPVDVSPRPPESFELRVVIMEAREVKLRDSYLFGGSSDVYFRCWLGDPSTSLKTDVEYRCTGDCQFNWRMVFPFQFRASQNKMLLRKSGGWISKHDPCLVPCHLSVQAFDSELVTDDFLGAIQLDLCKLAAPARSHWTCYPADPSAPTINLFKARKARGWWPLYTREQKHKGSVNLSLEILSMDEAILEPVGPGREGPKPLETPFRPNSFNWMTSPHRALKASIFNLCNNYRYQMLVIFCICLFIMFLMNLPAQLAKKLVNLDTQ